MTSQTIIEIFLINNSKPLIFSFYNENIGNRNPNADNLIKLLKEAINGRKAIEYFNEKFYYFNGINIVYFTETRIEQK